MAASVAGPFPGPCWPLRASGANGVERNLRLRREGEIRAARSRGRAISDGPFVIRYLRNTSEPPANRYAVVAGKKSGGSVQRNRLKRVTREALRGLHPRLQPGFDFVIIIRGTIDELPGTTVANEVLTRMLRRAGLLPADEAERASELA
jgi:ribonuclease P protein component